MIQRIQSVYLFVATLFCVLAMAIPLGLLSNAPWHSCGVRLDKDFTLTLGLVGLLLLSALGSLLTIFLYKKRMAQIRLAKLTIFFQVGFYLVFGVYVYSFQKMGASFQLGWGVLFPLLSLFLTVLAIRAIRHDEELVHAADRLR